jgi:hypothetical protein
MLPRRGHRASSWRRYREGNVRSLASPGSVSLVIVGSKDRRVARRGRNYRLSRCDAGHMLTCLAYCRTVPIDQGATCDRDRQAGERGRTKTLLPDLGTVPLNQSERTYFLCSAMLPALGRFRRGCFIVKFSAPRSGKEALNLKARAWL